MNGRERGVLVWGALLLSIIAVVLSGFTLLSTAPPAHTSTEEIAEEVYQRILSEVWEVLRPVYEDFDIPLPESPASFRDTIAPYLDVERR